MLYNTDMNVIEVKQKHCWACDGWFPATSQYFHCDKTKYDGLHGSCKVCKRESKGEWQKNNLNKTAKYSADYRESHPEYWAEYLERHPRPPSVPRINRRAANHKYVWSVKEQGCCVFCGEQRPEVLNFHYREPKEKSFEISQPRARPLDKVKFEIAKCDIMCFNCHTSLHYWEKHK